MQGRGCVCEGCRKEVQQTRGSAYIQRCYAAVLGLNLAYSHCSATSDGVVCLLRFGPLAAALFQY